MSQISFTNKITLQIQISTDKAFGFFVGTQLFRLFGNSNLSVGFQLDTGFILNVTFTA